MAMYSSEQHNFHELISGQTKLCISRVGILFVHSAFTYGLKILVTHAIDLHSGGAGTGQERFLGKAAFLAPGSRHP